MIVSVVTVLPRSLTCESVMDGSLVLPRSCHILVSSTAPISELMAAPARMALDHAWEDAEAARAPIRARGAPTLESQVRKALSDNCWMMTAFQKDGLRINGARWADKCPHPPFFTSQLPFFFSSRNSGQFFLGKSSQTRPRKWTFHLRLRLSE